MNSITELQSAMVCKFPTYITIIILVSQNDIILCITRKFYSLEVPELATTYVTVNRNIGDNAVRANNLKNVLKKPVD